MKNVNKAKRTLIKSISLFLCLVMVLGTVSLDWSALTAAAADTSNSSSSDDIIVRKELNFNHDWKFSLSDPTGAEKKSYKDSSWETVDLPHDFSITQEFSTTNTERESGQLPTGTGWYRKMFTIPTEYEKSDIWLTFDGVYNNAYVYVNGELIGENHYGYNSFSINLGDYVIRDGNTWNCVAVKVVSEMASSRWYSGSGITRDVTMTILNQVHVSHYGTQITTPTVNSSSATVAVKLNVENTYKDAATVQIKSEIKDPSGKVVATDSTNRQLASGENIDLTFSQNVANPQLWGTDTPNLYTQVTTITDTEGNVLDTNETTFGIRTIEWSASTGFSLNGEKMKLKGVCMHHDQGALGAVQEYDAIYRQMSIMKEMGVNAIRTSHNTASKVLIQVCNELGLLVLEELFDGWEYSKNGNSNDFGKYFNVSLTESNKLMGASSDLTWATFVTKETVLRDRNDPCVFMWDIGNELAEGTNTSVAAVSTKYAEYASQIRNTILAYDTTRSLTQGNNYGSVWSVDNYVDVIGANYHITSWTTQLSKPFFASESISAITSRGVYDYSGTDRQGGKLGNGSYELMSYDNSYVPWGNSASAGWYKAAVNDWYSGEFVWTGFDYIGEPTPWNDTGSTDSTVPNSSYFGIVDTAGFEKDQYYLYRSWWQDKDTTLHLLPGTWDENELYLDNGYAYVNVYSNADNIKLYLNDALIATAKSTVNTTSAGYTYRTWTETVVNSSVCNTNEIDTTDKELYAQFGVKYAAGTLSVKAFDANGNEITDTVGTNSVTSGKTTAKIVSKLWGEDSFTADGESFAYIEFTAVDDEGNPVVDYNGTLNITVTNDGVIAGVDNGYQGTTDKFQQSSVLTSDTTATIQMFNGKALAIVRTTENANNVQITATTSDNLTVDGTTFTTTAQTEEQKQQYFENVVTQSAIEYEDDIYSQYDELKTEFDALEDPSTSTDAGETVTTTTYEYYPVTTVTTTDATFLESGDYIISGLSPNGTTTGSLGYDWFKNDNFPDKDYTAVRTTGAAATASDPVWHFEHIENSSYYIYYTDSSNVKHYLSCNTVDTSLRTQTDPFEFTLTANNDGTFYISYGSTVIVYYEYSSFSDYLASTTSTASEASKITLYSVNGSTVTQVTPTTTTAGSYIDIKEQEYAIYNVDTWGGTTYSGVMSYDADTNGKTKGLDIKPATISGTTLTMDDDYVYIIEPVENSDGTKFYIKTPAGKYLNLGSGNGAAVLSDTPEEFTAYVVGDGRVAFYNSSSIFMDHFRQETYFSGWSSSTSKINNNNKFALYAKKTTSTSVITGATVNLYNAIKNGLEYNPGSYSSEVYDTLFTALQEGMTVYKNTSSTDAEKQAAADAITAAIEGLSDFVTKFDATLFRYGYDPSSSTPFNVSTNYYNEQQYAKMVQVIKADENILNQIKTIIDYDGTNGTTWEDGYADQALEDAIYEYARIYTVVFTGYSVTGDSTTNSEAKNNQDFYATFWNFWAKDNTQGASEQKHEGASIQGIFSQKLDPETGLPVMHDAYTSDSGLSYLSGETTLGNNGITALASITLNTGASATKSVSLAALSNISPYVADLFSRNNEYADGSDTVYSKFYWDTEFPFLTTTDEYGVNHYTYDSSNSSKLIRGSYDDEKQTAVLDYYDQENWSVNRQWSSAGQGFFPFNYRTDEDITSFTGQNAIYHFGVSFNTDFHIPATGTYSSNVGDDIVFNFSGDDDVLVYVDDTLVLDNGGLHGARSCSINFTQCTVTYQYAMDLESQTLVTDSDGNVTENEAVYSYDNRDNLSDDAKAAVEKLHAIIGDGQNHKLSFYYLERGSTESNCKIEFNLQQTSTHIALNDQTLVTDFGLDTEYDVTKNNTISKTAVSRKSTIEYVGTTETAPTTTISFEKVPEGVTLFDDTGIYTQTGDSGTITADNKGVVKFVQTNMQFNKSMYFWYCVKITNDPTYAAGRYYYTFEKYTVIPATNIYYEEDFCEGAGGLTYKDGTVPSSFDNSTANYGVWTTVTEGDKTAQQAADLVGDSDANVYGYDLAYKTSAVYSNGTARKVTVSPKNNPNKKYAGAEGGSWPTVTFTFSGTGFDLIGLTNNKTGVFTVDVYSGTDTTGAVVKQNVVDTYYGSSYVQLYSGADGKPTGTETSRPFYWTKNNTYTTTPTYYGTDGVITSTVTYKTVDGTGYTVIPTYYDANGNITETETETPAYAYAYAYGWINDSEATTSLYQIPVIAIEDLDYGTYTVKITAAFSTFYNHYNTDTVNGESIKSYDLYIDGIRVYDPAGHDDIEDTTISESYAKDGEHYPNYIELRNLLIGVDTFGESTELSKKGVIFIDGIPQLDNDIEKYKDAGPNNELYLAAGQAIAFEIWATAVPSDLQLFMKSASGTPTFSFTANGITTDLKVASGTMMAYSLNSFLPVASKLKWTQTSLDGKYYYTSGTVVIANNSEQDGILSLGEMKWTFSKSGGQGYFKIPTSTAETEEVSLMTTALTYNNAVSVVSAMYTDTSIAASDIKTSDTPIVKGEDTVITINTSSDVKTLLIKKADGTTVEPVSVEQIAKDLENDSVTWQVTLSCDDAGTYTYTVTGVNEYGNENKNPTSFTVTVETPVEETTSGTTEDTTTSDSGETKDSFLKKIQGFFDKIIEFFRKLFSWFK